VPRKRRFGRLNVFLNGRLVGRLQRATSGAIDFRYDQGWLVWPHTMAISLSLPLREDRYIGAPVAAVFDNLLPDDALIRRKVAEHVGAEGSDAFSLLATLGRDCVGALQFLDEDDDPGPPGTIRGRAVSDRQIAELVDNLARNPLGLGRDDDFRISIAGAQEKTALLRHRGRWLKPLGSTPTTHILKPQIGTLPNGIDLTHSVENEYFCLTLTKALGLPSAEVEIANFAGRRVLIVERFDRILAGKRLLRVPQEDSCQALSVSWTQKYEADGGPGIARILKLLAGSDEADADRRRFLKAQIAFWLLGATDGHAKNFSIFLSPGGGYRMTPLYDVISAQPSLAAGQIRRNRMKLAMAVGDRRHYAVWTISGRHFVQSAEAAGLGRTVALEVIDDVLASAAPALERTLAGMPKNFPPGVAVPIERGFAARLRQLELDRGAIR